MNIIFQVAVVASLTLGSYSYGDSGLTSLLEAHVFTSLCQFTNFSLCFRFEYGLAYWCVYALLEYIYFPILKTLKTIVNSHDLGYLKLTGPPLFVLD